MRDEKRGYVYEELSSYEIANRLKADSNAGWSHDGALALADYLIEYAEETGESFELDIIAIRCDFSEYSSAIEAYDQYIHDGCDDSEMTEEKALEELRENTQVITFDGGVIIQNY